MYAVIIMSSKVYGRDLDLMSDDERESYINSFTSECTPVTLVENLEDFEETFNMNVELVP